MASIQQRGSKFQLRLVHKLLPQPFFHTYETQQEAEHFGGVLQAILDSGRIPEELLAKPKRERDELVLEVIRAYTLEAPITTSDDDLLGVVVNEIPGTRVSDITVSWADAYIKRLKHQNNLAPGTIRKRIGVLARVLDWYLVREAERMGVATAPTNALRMLPVGYSQYSKLDAPIVKAAGNKIKVDVKRDRRLSADDVEKIRAVLVGKKREDRERSLEKDPDFLMMFDLIIDTGLRLSEAYRMRSSQVDLERGVLNVEGSKGARGMIKPRTVPLKRTLRESLAGRQEAGQGLLFPFWNGDVAEMPRTSSRLSARFVSSFEYAGVMDFTVHDLRHEATCRWVELRAPGGGWTFSEAEICRIMGWTSTNMILRYMSLRGEDLSSRLL